MTTMNEKRIDSSVDSSDLMAFAEAYASLGGCVCEQVKDLLNGSYDEVNPNALDMIEDRLGGFHEDLDVAIEECRDERDDERDDENDEDDDICASGESDTRHKEG